MFSNQNFNFKLRDRKNLLFCLKCFGIFLYVIIYFSAVYVMWFKVFFAGVKNKNLDVIEDKHENGSLSHFVRISGKNTFALFKG